MALPGALKRDKIDQTNLDGLDDKKIQHIANSQNQGMKRTDLSLWLCYHHSANLQDHEKCYP